MKLLTLVFLVTEDKICLALKKRGFGEGFWNGYGGKVEEGETLEQATCRELLEESRVIVEESDLKKVANHKFVYIDDGEMDVHVYFTSVWKGEPTETEEMRPFWYRHKYIPYEEMWEDDKYWLPRVLEGEKIKSKVWFDETGLKIKKMKFESVEEL